MQKNRIDYTKRLAVCLHNIYGSQYSDIVLDKTKYCILTVNDFSHNRVQGSIVIYTSPQYDEVVSSTDSSSVYLVTSFSTFGRYHDDDSVGPTLVKLAYEFHNRTKDQDHYFIVTDAENYNTVKHFLENVYDVITTRKSYHPEITDDMIRTEKT